MGDGEPGGRPSTGSTGATVSIIILRVGYIPISEPQKLMKDPLSPETTQQRNSGAGLRKSEALPTRHTARSKGQLNGCSALSKYFNKIISNNSGSRL